MDALELSVRTAEVKVVEGRLIIIYTNLEVKPCTRELLPGEYWDQNAESGFLKAHLYINPIQTISDNSTQREVKLKSSFPSLDTTGVVMTIKMCDEKANPGCRKGMTGIPGLYININMKESYFNASDSENPIQDSIKTAAILLGDNQYVFKDFTYLKNRLKTDNGLVFEKNIEEEYFSLAAEDYQVRPYRPEVRSIFTSRLLVNNVLSLNERRYMKVQELLADVGGFIKVLAVVVKFIGEANSNYNFIMEFHKKSQ